MPTKLLYQPDSSLGNKARVCSLITGVCCVVSASTAMHLTTASTQTQSLSSFTLVSIEPDQSEKEDEAQEGIKECVITLSSGRTITGELVYEGSREVIIGINGIETTFQRKNVANIVILPPVAERYAQLRSTVSDDDIEARLALVEWLRARKAYQLAIHELESILEIAPKNQHAKVLHTWLKEYDKLADNVQEDKEDSNEPEKTEEPKEPKEPERTYSIEKNGLPLLSEEQINLMKVYEVDLRNPPKLRVPDETMFKLMRQNPDRFSPDEDQRNQVLDLPEIEKLKLLFTLRARDLYAEVEILENPRSLDMFKDQVHSGRGWLVNACASTRCHGGVDAGSFQLINTKPNLDATAFTNLYIIENTKLSNGLPLIDFENPERSALLQMGMVQNKALIPHPEIPRGYPGTGFRPIFRNTRERKYQQAVEWIRSMYQPRPDLEFEYPLPETETLSEPDQNAP